MIDYEMLMELHQKCCIPDCVKMNKPMPFARADTVEERWVFYTKRS